MPLKFDVENINFDYFFLEKVMNMSEHQKELLPKELMYKIFVKGFRVNTKSSSKLSFLAKLYILVRALNKRWILLIEDDEKGLNTEDFFKYKEQTKKRNYTSDSATDLISDGEFVLGDSELFDTFDKLNRLSTSPAYNYLMKVKNKNYLKPNEFKEGRKYVVSWLNDYESKRKKLVVESGLTVAEWLTLSYLYDGKEKTGAFLYIEKFRYSYNTSSTKLKLSFSTLQSKGFISKHGNGKGCKLQITALGIDKVNAICDKYIAK